MTPPVPSFELADHLVASGPPESRGVPRDRVRMLVATDGGLEHRSVAELPTVLGVGDLLVVNTSDTLPAALGGVTSDGQRVEVHLSTLDPGATLDYPAALVGTTSRWMVEVRTPGPLGGESSRQDRTGTRIRLTGGGILRLDCSAPAGSTSSRLWCGALRTPIALGKWLHEYGDPIRYRYASARWPLSAYRTEYADTPGSAEMPSAGRPLTKRLLYRLRARGVQVAALLLHTGVSSAESGEPLYAEWFAVPASTAAAVHAARAENRRVIAVGTTVVRALESAGAIGGTGSGWTDLLVSPERGVTVVDGLLTGWHEPTASHLLMLEALAGPDLLAASYAEALRAGYRWHEFGDVHLMLPGG
ncbi:MAG: S-adenosylmethionine:tRNA ribosyltransferase-isomerase [Actinomycetota bacterium]|nr:S-adenosylmethionine:tRNA ribosyltransferase-isomerase [Actinomycetota bacterium]